MGEIGCLLVLVLLPWLWVKDDSTASHTTDNRQTLYQHNLRNKDKIKIDPDPWVFIQHLTWTAPVCFFCLIGWNMISNMTKLPDDLKSFAHKSITGTTSKTQISWVINQVHTHWERSKAPLSILLMGDVVWHVEPALQANGETDPTAKISLHLLLHASYKSGRNHQHRKRKQRPPKILLCWLLQPKTSMVCNKTGGPLRGKHRWAHKPILTPQLTQWPTYLQQQTATKGLCSPTNSSQKLARCMSLRSNQVAFKLYFNISQFAVVK